VSFQAILLIRSTRLVTMTPFLTWALLRDQTAYMVPVLSPRPFVLRCCPCDIPSFHWRHFLSFFLFWISKTRPNLEDDEHLISHLGPKNLSRTSGPDHYLVYGRPNQIPNLVGKTGHNVSGLACVFGLTNSHTQSP